MKQEKWNDPEVMNILTSADIIIITETWIHDGEIDDYKINGYISNHCCAPRRDGRKTRGGVSIFTKSNINNLIKIEDTPYKPYMIWMNMDKSLIIGAHTDILLIACYMPPEGATTYKSNNSEPTNPIKDLSNDLITRRRNRSIIIIGDMNARTGMLNDNLILNYPRCNEDKDVNNFGKDLTNTCITHELAIMNGRTCGDAEGHRTHYNHNQRGGSTIDLIVMSTDLYRCTDRLEVMPKTIHSDHLPVRCGLWKQEIDNNEDYIHTGIKIATHIRDSNKPSFESKDVCERYREAIGKESVRSILSEITSSLNDGLCDINDALSNMKNVINKCVSIARNKRIRSNQAGSINPWWNEECNKARMAFKVAHKKDLELIIGGAFRLSPETIVLRRHYKFIINTSKLNFELDESEKLANMFFHEPNKFWNLYRGKHDKCAIEDTNRWTRYFRDLVGENKKVSDMNVALTNGILNNIHTNNRSLSNDNGNIFDWRSCEVVNNRRASAQYLNDPIRDIEITDAIDDLNIRAAKGSDGVFTQSIKEAWEIDDRGRKNGNIIEPHLKCIFNHILESGAYPDEWKANTLTPIYKGKGNPDEEGNYRGVSVAGTLAKMYGSILGNRLRKYLETYNLRARSQAGGRPKQGVHQHLFTIQHLKDLYKAPIRKGGRAAPLFMCFIDFEKAFDKVDRNLIWIRLEERGIHGKFLNAIKAVYDEVIIRVKINGKYGDDFETFLGVKQGDPLSMDLFGTMIEVISEMINTMSPNVGVQIGDDKVSNCLFVDDLTLITENAHDLQCAINIVEMFCLAFGFKINVTKTEYIVFHKDYIPDINIYYRNTLIRRTEMVKYLGLYFTNDNKNSPGFEHLLEKAGRASFAVQGKIKKMGNIVPELMVRLGNIMIRPIVLFACQIWGVNLMDIKKGLNTAGKGVEHIHIIFLRYILGCGKNITAEVLRAEASSPAYHIQIVKDVFRLWNSLKKETKSLAHIMWRNDIALMLNGYRDCWTYKALNSAHKMELCDFNPNDIRTEDTVENISNITFTQLQVKEALNIIYMERWDIHRNGNPLNTSIGYTMCRYINWIDEVNVVCNIKYNKHMHMRINNYMNINMIRFRVGAWRINVNNLNMKQIVRSERYCDYCIHNNCGKFCEDEEHVIFHCEAYGNCRLRHQPLFHGTKHNLKTFLSNDNQTGIAWMLWDIRKIRMNLDMKC